MIGRLRGEIIERTVDAIVVDVGGVGYQVTVPKRGGFAEGTQVDLHVHTHVREDALVLFGFAERNERDIFDLLITVPSIGPVKAMNILATDPGDVVARVVRADAKALGKLPGVGKRTAERMVVDLREKFAALAPRLATGDGDALSTDAAPSGLAADLVSALTHLGFKPAVAEREAARSVEKLGGDVDLDTLLRHALDQLRRR